MGCGCGGKRPPMRGRIATASEALTAGSTPAGWQVRYSDGSRSETFASLLRARREAQGTGGTVVPSTA